MDTFTEEQWEERLDAIESIALKNIKNGKKYTSGRERN